MADDGRCSHPTPTAIADVSFIKSLCSAKEQKKRKPTTIANMVCNRKKFSVFFAATKNLRLFSCFLALSGPECWLKCPLGGMAFFGKVHLVKYFYLLDVVVLWTGLGQFGKCVGSLVKSRLYNEMYLFCLYFSLFNIASKL